MLFFGKHKDKAKTTDEVEEQNKKSLEDMLYVMQPRADFVRSMDYFEDVKEFYAPLCRQYYLAYIERKELERIVLIGREFLLELADARYGGVSVFYWYRENGAVKIRECGNYFALSFDEEERKHLIGGEQTLDVCIRNGFIGYAFCLRNKWENILKGDKSWIEKAKESRRFAEIPVRRPQDDFMISLLELSEKTYRGSSDS